MTTAPQTLLILDTETTGLSPDDSQCIEVGAILFSVPHRAVLTQVSFLLPCLMNGAEFVNKIPAGITQVSQPRDEADAMFTAMVRECDAVVAHNASFDKQWFDGDRLPVIDKPWICTMDDISWPTELRLKSRPSVATLALAYGVPVWAAHRALTDCIYLAQVFERCNNLEELLLGSQEPRLLYRADVSYDDRELARAAGFRWNEAVPKAWSRKLTQREAEKLTFPVRQVQV